MAIITLINGLEYAGKTMIIFIAGLESIPDMYEEAASIDGANGVQVFRHITIPMLFLACIPFLALYIIGGLILFGLFYSLPDGGPGYASHSLSTLINTMYFANQRAGFSAAVGIFSFVFIMSVSWILRSYLDRKDAEYNG